MRLSQERWANIGLDRTFLAMDPRYKSSIPPGTTERLVSEYRCEGAGVWLRRTECVLEGKVVGEREYEEDGALIVETPLKNGKRHGVVYDWYDGVHLSCAEPYFEGKPHGTARQWSEDGILLGTYRLVHGTGIDVWRHMREDGTICVSEIHNMRDGQAHGFEWWLNEDQQSVLIERHWDNGKLHGIEREWNLKGRLSRGWPRYWVQGKQLTKRQYVAAAERDNSLPKIRPEDLSPSRTFPPEIQRILGRV